ncbi:hypothetical protein [Caldimonas brevitalea]|uniref:Uncharacterized protein n=1 Tax=Caldimonas brevitalea TaxID=413882 RepID=A0A0G3BWW7_9BURK|nr:hypothetical protein [Caldimonas brevitalea]AKJ31856.1 hypothetical protein AAW51_5165 [Caldimonas brevitalea]
MFLTSDGRIHAAGLEELGLLGNGQNRLSVHHRVPVATLLVGPSGLGRVTSIAASEHNSFAVLANGAVYGWGHADIGDGSAAARLSPAPVGSLDLQ